MRRGEQRTREKKKKSRKGKSGNQSTSVIDDWCLARLCALLKKKKKGVKGEVRKNGEKKKKGNAKKLDIQKKRSPAYYNSAVGGGVLHKSCAGEGTKKESLSPKGELAGEKSLESSSPHGDRGPIGGGRAEKQLKKSPGGTEWGKESNQHRLHDLKPWPRMSESHPLAVRVKLHRKKKEYNVGKRKEMTSKGTTREKRDREVSMSIARNGSRCIGDGINYATHVTREAMTITPFEKLQTGGEDRRGKKGPFPSPHVVAFGPEMGRGKSAGEKRGRKSGKITGDDVRRKRRRAASKGVTLPSVGECTEQEHGRPPRARPSHHAYAGSWLGREKANGDG